MSECRELRGIFENKTEKKHEVVNHYRPGNRVHEVDKFVSHIHQPPLHPRR